MNYTQKQYIVCITIIFCIQSSLSGWETSKFQKLALFGLAFFSVHQSTEYINTPTMYEAKRAFIIGADTCSFIPAVVRLSGSNPSPVSIASIHTVATARALSDSKKPDENQQLLRFVSGMTGCACSSLAVHTILN